MPYPSKVNAESILAAAVLLVEEQGPNGLSMRELAKHLQLTVSSLYRYYPDRAALEEALGAHAAEMLDRRLKAVEHKSEALARALLQYRRFAENNRALYRLLLTPQRAASAAVGPFKELWNTFLRIVSGVTGRPDDTSAAVAVWAFVHGFVELQHSGNFGASGPAAGFQEGVAALTRGFASKPVKKSPRLP